MYRKILANFLYSIYPPSHSPEARGSPQCIFHLSISLHKVLGEPDIPYPFRRGVRPSVTFSIDNRVVGYANAAPDPLINTKLIVGYAWVNLITYSGRFTFGSFDMALALLCISQTSYGAARGLLKEPIVSSLRTPLQIPIKASVDSLVLTKRSHPT